MQTSKLLSQLEFLGFTPNEANVYLALVKHGPCTAGPLINETQLHRNIVYVSLSHLISKKYVTEKNIRGRKTFSVSSPEVIENEFSKKAQIASELSKKLSEAATLDPQEVSVHQGLEEYADLMQVMVDKTPENAQISSFGTVSDGLLHPIAGKIHQTILKKLSLNNIKYKIIGNRRKKKLIQDDLKKTPKGIFDIKYFPVNLEDPAVVCLFPELNTLLYIINPGGDFDLTVIRLKNIRLTQNVQNLFNNLWKISLR